jgi:hypothetical protein
MTKQQAEIEAKVRWGETAFVYDRNEHPEVNWKETKGLKWVGRSSIKGTGYHPYGNGYTWEQAFEDAEDRESKMPYIVRTKDNEQE